MPDLSHYLDTYQGQRGGNFFSPWQPPSRVAPGGQPRGAPVMRRPMDGLDPAQGGTGATGGWMGMMGTPQYGAGPSGTMADAFSGGFSMPSFSGPDTSKFLSGWDGNVAQRLGRAFVQGVLPGNQQGADGTLNNVGKGLAGRAASVVASLFGGPGAGALVNKMAGNYIDTGNVLPEGLVNMFGGGGNAGSVNLGFAPGGWQTSGFMPSVPSTTGTWADGGSIFDGRAPNFGGGGGIGGASSSGGMGGAAFKGSSGWATRLKSY